MEKAFFLLLTLLLISHEAIADVHIGGSVPQNQRRPFREKMTLSEGLDALAWIGCSRPSVISKQTGKTYIFDLSEILLNRAPNFILSDGDIITVPQHTWPCMSEQEEADLAKLVTEYNIITRQKLTFPSDWRHRVLAAAGLCAKIKRDKELHRNPSAFHKTDRAAVSSDLLQDQSDTRGGAPENTSENRD